MKETEVFMTLQEEQKLRAVYDSASDEQLENILANSKDYRPGVVDIVAEIIQARKTGKLQQKKLVEPSVKIQNMSVVDYKPEAGFTIYLIRTCFPWIFAIMFWLIVFGGMVSGAKTAMDFADKKSEETIAAVLGGLFGLIGGFIVAVWAHGVVAAILNMDANLQYLAEREKAKGGK